MSNIDINDILACPTPCADYDQSYWDFFYECLRKAQEESQ